MDVALVTLAAVALGGLVAFLRHRARTSPEAFRRWREQELTSEDRERISLLRDVHLESNIEEPAATAAAESIAFLAARGRGRARERALDFIDGAEITRLTNPRLAARVLARTPRR